MADTVTVDNGALTDYTVATDDVTVGGAVSGHVAFVKLVDGALDGTNPVGADTSTTSNRGLFVETHSRMTAIHTRSGGLTTSTTAYTAGDQVGSVFSISNASRWTGGTGSIVGVSLTDRNDVIGAYDVVFSRASLTLAGNNSPWSVSDDDSMHIIEVVQLGGAIDLGGNRFARAMGINVPFDTGAGTTLYASLITRTDHTFFTNATDLQLTVYLIQD